MKNRVAWGLAVVLGVVLLGAAVCGASFWLSVTFGPRYNVTDYDPELTRYARSALPTIAALNRYHTKYSAFPIHASQLAHCLPPGSVKTLGNGPHLIEVGGFDYWPDRDGKSYGLSGKIDWETTFGYWYDGSKGHWIFSPPIGSKSKEIILKP